ncbi:MAG: hypothetical protein ACXAD7_06455 [Candidatus Kariarchaeaceae archaeon]
MVLEFNPEGPVDQFEDIDYQEIFTDINSPGIFIAQTESDLKAKLIVLDGHSTILVYTHGKDLAWQAFNDLGQYKYQPDKVGDGLLIFPHTFYFEFTLKLATQEIEVQANFDGTGIKALTMPMKDVPIDEMVSSLQKRFSSTLSKILKPIDEQLEVNVGKKLKIPKNVMGDVSLKLALMGINLSSLQVSAQKPIEIMKGEVVEKIYDEPPTKMKEMLEREEKEKKESKKKRRRVKAAMPADEVSISMDDLAEPTLAAGAGGAAKGGPPPSAAPGGPPPPGAPAPSPQPSVPTATTAPGAPPPLAAPGGPPPAAKSEAKKAAKVIPPPKAKPKKKKKKDVIPPMPSPTPPTRRAAKMAEVAESKPIMEDAILGEDDAMEEEIDELLPSELAGLSMEETLSMRYTHASYFERMIPNRAYPLLIKISTEEMKVKKSVSSIMSGEKLSEAVDTMVISEDSPIVTIRPDFPGCFVVPNQIDVDASKPKVEALFHVTPIAIGKLTASIKFRQNNRTMHTMELKTKVINHRLSKWAAWIGAAASALPAFFAFIWNVPPDKFMNERLDEFAPAMLQDYGLMLPGAVTAGLFALSGFFYMLRRPRKSSRSIAFPG